MFYQECTNGCSISTWSVDKKLSNKTWKSDEWYSEDDRYHTCLVHLNRKIWSLFSSCASIDERNFAISLRKENNHVDNTNCKCCKEEEKRIVVCTKKTEERCRHTCKNARKDDNRSTITKPTLCNKITEPEEEVRSSCDDDHRRKHSSPEITGIDKVRPLATEEAIHKIDHSITLCKSERKSEISCIDSDLLLSLFTFFLEGFEFWYYYSHELHDDRRIDIWSETHENNRKILKSTTKKSWEERKTWLWSKIFLKCSKRTHIHSWNWKNREKLVNTNESKCYENTFTDGLRLPDPFKMF